MRTSLGCWVPLDAQVLCQTLGQKPSHGQTVAILKKKKQVKRNEQRLSSCRCTRAGLLRCHDHLVDSDSAAQRAHASKVRCTASPVVKGDISVRMKEDVNRT